MKSISFKKQKAIFAILLRNQRVILKKEDGMIQRYKVISMWKYFHGNVFTLCAFSKSRVACSRTLVSSELLDNLVLPEVVRFLKLAADRRSKAKHEVTALCVSFKPSGILLTAEAP